MIPLRSSACAEGPWIDAKGGGRTIQALRAGSEELAKDMAAFANSEHGGLLVIGTSTLP